MAQKILILCILISGMCAQQTVDKILAVVGDRIITQRDVDDALAQMAMRNPQLNKEEKRDQVFQYMIDDNLLYIKSQLDSVEINEEYVEQHAAQMWQQYVQQAGGEARLEAIFNSPAKKIRKKIKLNAREQIARDGFQRQFRSKIKVSHAEVEAFYKTHKDSLPEQPEQVEIARIVMFPKVSESTMKAAQEKAKKALERLKNGEDFTALAKEISEGPTRPNGGYLGKVKVGGGFVKEYEDAAMAIENPGDISEPILTQFGLHIIKLHSKSRDEFETSHILFLAKADETDSEKSMAKMNEIRSDILSGKLAFENAVKQYSEDKASNKKAGYLGVFESDKLPDEAIKTKLSFLNDGDITEPFIFEEGGKTAVQFVKLIKRIPAHKYDFKSDYTAVEQFALRLKQENAFKKVLAELKKEIPIEIYQ